MCRLLPTFLVFVLWPQQEGKDRYNEIMGLMSTSINVADLKDCDIIVEAIVENEPIKIDFYKKLGVLIKPDCIFASNTSSLLITNMAEASGRPDRFVGMHFFNPVQMMKLVEVIKTVHTSPKVVDVTTHFTKAIGKVSVSCGDTPGFIVNRLLVPYMASAMAMLDRKDATIGDIDVSMVLGSGHPMGPLHLADYVGLDTCMNILTGWTEKYPNEQAFKIPQVLKDRVAKGSFGAKTGKGFYIWDGAKIVGPNENNI
jgi:3-hydroxyacyl-CoA dehydrogenase